MPTYVVRPVQTQQPRVHVGTSGFSYDEWRPAFYPDDLKKDAMLPFYAERLPAVELNNTFYRLPNAKMAAKWRAQVPDTFRFAVKASQRLTWTQKLKDCGDAADPLCATQMLYGLTPAWVYVCAKSVWIALPKLPLGATHN